MGTGENERVVVEVGGGKWLGIGFFSFFPLFYSMDRADGILIEEIRRQKGELEAAWQGMVVPLGIQHTFICFHFL